MPEGRPAQVAGKWTPFRFSLVGLASDSLTSVSGHSTRAGVAVSAQRLPDRDAPAPARCG